jgi:DNA-binding MarR family transcriptional regulator
MKMSVAAPWVDEGTADASARPLAPQLIQLLKLATMISRPMQDAVASPNGISMNELKIIMCLAGEGPCAGHDLTSLMGIPPMNVSRALASLAERGWVEPAVDPANRRRKPVRLSALGAAAQDAMTADIGDVARQLLGSLSDRDRTALDRIIGILIARMQSWPGAERSAPQR